MSRPPRVDFPGASYHIMNHAGGGRPLFSCDRDRWMFLRILGELPGRYGLEISAYALMDSHYHLRARSEKARVSPAIGYLQSQYAKRHNYFMGLDGGLFRSRFKSRLVTREDHWVYLIAYQHLNPVRARLAVSADRYRWTSHLSYLYPARRLTWLTIDLSPFGSEEDYQKYITSVRCGACPMPDEFDKVLFREPASVVYPGSNELAKSDRIEDVLRIVASVVGSSTDYLKQTVRGRNGNPGRVLAIYWLVIEAGLSLSETARHFGIERSSASEVFNKVSRGVYRGDPRLNAFQSQLVEIFKV